MEAKIMKEMNSNRTKSMTRPGNNSKKILMCYYSSFLSFPSFLFFFRSIIVLNVDVYFLLLNCSLTMYFSESSESVPLNTEPRHMERIESNGRHHEATIFTLRELVDATKNFSLDFHLGRGGFGCVYKAYLNDGQVCSLLVIQYTSYLQSYNSHWMSLIGNVDSI